MTSYSREEIDQLKASVNLADYAQHLGVTLKPVGHRYRGFCPFHTDSTPSFYINPAEGFYYCFGCRKSGDVISLVQQLQNLDFLQAVEHVKSYAGIHPVSTVVTPEVSFKRD